MFEALDYSLRQRRLYDEYIFNHESDEDIIIYQAHKNYHREICPHKLNYKHHFDHFVGQTHYINRFWLCSDQDKFSLHSINCICKNKSL